MASILLDTDVFVQAAYKAAVHHLRAAELVARGLREKGVFCISPLNIVEFAAVVTRPRFVDPVLPAAQVERISDLLYRSRTLSKIHPKRGTVARMIHEGTRLGVNGTAWYDLYLATTMRDAGVQTIITENVGDFRMFPFVVARHIGDSS